MTTEIVRQICKAYSQGYSSGIMLSGSNPHYFMSEQYKAWNIGYEEGRRDRNGKQRRHDDIVENVIEIEGA